MPAETREKFWTLPLRDMTREEWEALCDHCGLCCLIKLEDEDGGEVAYTSVHCRLYDPAACRCGSYPLRRMLVPGCVSLTPDSLAEHAEWMPRTCAYRRLHEGRGLPDWHPLIGGDPEGARKAGVAVPAAATPEYEVDVDDLEDHVIEGIL
jgi:uncharacterized cysteine cluster protein YcgN (CxxCxxCC family)